MVSLRTSLFLSISLVFLFFACSKSTNKSQSEVKEPTATPSKPKNSSSSSSENDKPKEVKKPSASEKKKDQSGVENIELVPEIEKSMSSNEKGKNTKLRGVNREAGSSQRVLDLLLPDKKKLDESKILTGAKKGLAPNFIANEINDVPIIRLTNTRFIDEKFPTISNNGKILVYEGWHHPESGENSAQAIYSTLLDETLRKTVLVKNGFNNVRPFFHPNLKEVFFSTDVYKNEFHVASTPLDGSGATNLNFRKICRDVLDVSISKNSDYAISYFKEGKTTPSIGIVNQGGNFFPEIAEGKEVGWSQSGDRIVFVNLNGVFLDVYTAKQDGSDLIQVTTHFGICHHPSFSPDDQWIVFSAITEVNKKYDLFIASKDGKNLMQITNAAENDRNPYWGKDGWIYFETERFDNNSEIAKVDSAIFIKKFEEQKTPPVFVK